MKINSRIISLALSVLMIVGIVSASGFSSSAIVEIVDGDYSYVKNSDNTYALYSYSGSDTDITLPTVALGRNVTEIYKNAFESSNITSVVIPEGYVSIGESAFYGCADITEITLPSTVTSLGSMVFNSCTALSSVDLSQATSLTAIPFAAFQDDSSLKSIIIPSNVTSIGNNALTRSGLTSIELPSSVESMGTGVFSECKDLTTVTLSDSLTEISDGAFENCTSLTEVTVPNGVTAIGKEAFAGCTLLANVELPTTLTSIGDSAFEEDNSLTEISIPATVTQIGGNAFYPMSIRNKITVTCFEGSYAETYCEENLVPSQTTPKIMGDANADGKLNILDVTAIQKYKIGDMELNEYGLSCADVNHDNQITVRDATLIQMKLAKYDVGF